MPIELPDGQYIHFCRAVRPTSGGRTRAVLMRARMLAHHGGVPTVVTTFDEEPNYPDVRRQLHAQGLLSDDVALLNLYEHYRTTGVDDRPALGIRTPETEAMSATDDLDRDGNVYRTSYHRAGSTKSSAVDFRRPDGTVAIRRLAPTKTRRGRWYLLNTGGEVVGRWNSFDVWIRDWVRDLTPPDQRGFVLTDRPFYPAMLQGLPADRFYLIDVMHNPHLKTDRRWDSPLNPVYEQMLGNIAGLDGLVSLTGRQRDDIVARFGHTDNLFVVPNPVEVPNPPTPMPTRETHRFTIVARLEIQKRIEHALRALAIVRESEPDAVLDIYGQGDLLDKLEQLTVKLGIEAAVTFHGFDPAARSNLWTATAFLMTSRFEGYPLATLESMSHGCPVISYDLKYGPRDQITDGMDGFLVDERDFRTMAARMVELIGSPEQVAEMGVAARKKSAAHSPEAFVQDWKHVLDSVVAQKPTRTRLRNCVLLGLYVGYGRPGSARWLPRRPGRPIRLHRQPDRAAALRVDVRVPGRSRGPGPASVTATVDAIETATGRIAAVPVTVEANGSLLTITGSFAVEQMFGDEAGTVRVRLRLVARNSAWQRDIALISAGG